MLLKRIREDIILKHFIRNTCSENAAFASISADINENSYVIIKIDEYYNANVLNPPASPDCLVVQQCKDGSYKFTIIELKDIHSSADFKVENIISKFETCLNDFMAVKFKAYFNRPFKTPRLYFVTLIKNYKDDGLGLNVFRNKPVKFNGRKILIEPRMPNPLITAC